MLLGLKGEKCHKKSNELINKVESLRAVFCEKLSDLKLTTQLMFQDRGAENYEESTAPDTTDQSRKVTIKPKHINQGEFAQFIGSSFSSELLIQHFQLQRS